MAGITGFCQPSHFSSPEKITTSDPITWEKHERQRLSGQFVLDI
jgi:hypothetical protein